MTDQEAANLPVPDRYTEITIAGDTLLSVFRPEEGMGVPVRVICTRLNLKLKTQSERLRKHPVLREGLRRDRVPVDGRMVEVVIILHKYIPFWLATIDPHDVNDDMRGHLVRYQTELVDLLASVYLARQGLVATPEQRGIVLLGEQLRQILAAQRQTEDRLDGIDAIIADIQQHIPVAPAQAEHLLRTMKEIGARTERKTGNVIYAMLQARFRKELGTQRYDTLPAMQYEQALTWLADRAREYLGDDAEGLPAQERLL